MGVQVFTIHSNLVNCITALSHSKLQSQYSPARFSSWQCMTRNRQSKPITNTSSVFSVCGHLTKKSFEIKVCQDPKSLVLLQDASKILQEKKNQDASAFAFDYIDEDIASIRRLFSDIESRQTSVSAYDTAWVAMVPSLQNSQSPQFPQCLSWIMDNQLRDGSWGLSDLPFIKDRLCHTLACIIALQTWNVGDRNVEDGLRFIRENIGRIVSENQYTPTGFEIIFTGMLEDARGLSLELPYDSPPIKLMLTEREDTLKRIKIDHMNEYDISLIYIVEGIHRIVDWNKVLRHQNKDGWLFHSPSATASALMHTRQPSCLKYLNSMLHNLGNGVPSVYPIKLFTAISMIDRLERLGIARHFKHEIKHTLDYVYSCWTNNEIIEGKLSASDIINCSISFRILRMHGYDVSPDIFLRFLEDGEFLPSVEKSGQAVTAMLNLYKASQVMFPGERILEDAKSLSRDYLVKQKVDSIMHNQTIVQKDLRGEVDFALSVPWIASLERIEHRRYIEQYGVDDIWIGKTLYKIPSISNDLFLTLAKRDYNMCQEIHQKEMQEFEIWYADGKFGDLNFARKKLAHCYFSAASTLFSPEMSNARMVWAKNAVLTGVLDDFYDVGGSIEELQCFLEAVRKWDVAAISGFSDSAQILFNALHNTISDIAQNAYAFRDRDVSIHLREIWYKILRSMMKEALWAKTGQTPSMQEYIENGESSVALEQFVLTSLYFVGPKLSQQTIKHPEYSELMQLVNNSGRLLNDIQSYKREAQEGKLNCVTLYMKEYPQTSVDDAIAKFRKTVNENTQKLLKKLLQPSVVPRECKQLHWNMLRIVHLFYLNADGFTSPTELLQHINAVIFDPVS